MTFVRTALRPLRPLLGLLAVAGIGPAAALAAPTPAQVPAEWISYAERASGAVSAFLGDESEASVRLRAYIDTTRSAPDAPTPELLLRIRIAPDGRVSEVGFTPFAHAEANADLRAALVGRQLDAPPPAMPQPLRIAIRLEPAPPAPSAAPTGPSPSTASPSAPSI